MIVSNKIRGTKTSLSVVGTSNASVDWAPFERLDIGALAVDQFSETALVDEVLHHCLFGNSTRLLATANAQFYVLAQKSRRFRECLRSADYICADGMPIVWACNSLYGGSVRRIAGVSLVEKLCQRGAAHRLRVFLLGGKPETADITSKLLKRRHPGIQIAGVCCPPYGFERREESLQEVLDQIAAAKPHVLFVGLGAPKQEIFIHHYIRALNVPLAIGIGGSFEILSGKLKRAPAWMQSSGLEWAYRLCQEPGRLWQRYLIGNFEFLWHVAKARLTKVPSREDEIVFGSPMELRASGESSRIHQ